MFRIPPSDWFKFEKLSKWDLLEESPFCFLSEIALYVIVLKTQWICLVKLK